MSLLREIQEGATDPSVSLADLLRKCLILARRLQHEPLATWAQEELSGYTSSDALPPYRHHKTEVRGTFVGPFDRQVTNYSIPSLVIDESHRDMLFTAYYSDGVAYYEELLQQSDSGKIAVPWPADFISYYGPKLMDGYHLVEAWQPISRGSVRSLLDQVRSRILNFVLDMEKENPAAGEAQPGGDPPVAPERVQQSFVTHIYGGTNVLAPGVQNVIKDVKIGRGDWHSLQRALEEVGVPADDVAALEQAIQADEGVEEPPGPAVKAWLGDLTARIGRGSVKVANTAAGSAIAALVLRYLGVV